jgi:hypothetical protein
MKFSDFLLIIIFCSHTLLGPGSGKAVLRFQEVRYKAEMLRIEIIFHALLHSHLVRGLEVLRVLPRRQMQLLRHCKCTKYFLFCMPCYDLL